MRTRLGLAGLVLLLVACGGDVPEGPPGDEAEIEAIRRCDAAYKAAL